MDQVPQSIINSILGGALAALGWFARQIWDAIKELRQDLYTVLQIGTGEGNPKARGVI